MPTRNINLTDRYNEFLTQQVVSGRFKNASEAVRAALHLLEQQDEEEKARLETLRREVHVGLDAYRKGDVIEIDSSNGLDALFPPLNAQ